jgi:hypothetical protein
MPGLAGAFSGASEVLVLTCGGNTHDRDVEGPRLHRKIPEE